MKDTTRRVITIPPKAELSTGQGNKRQLRVAAYCRVSTDDEEQLTSYEAQRTYYTDKIMKNPEWTMAGLFADEGITGTSAKKRPEFLRMIRKCRRGKIDMILTKSISRFARNTVDSLHYIRALKELGVAVVFEEQNINTLESDSEMIITLLSAFAQSESENMSANVTWGKRQAMREGRTSAISREVFGYKKDSGGQLYIIPEQAETVRRIYRLYLAGASVRMIQEDLIAQQLLNARGDLNWTKSSIEYILKNEKYCGDVLMQKTFRTDCISRKVYRNTGQLPMYLVQNDHEGIVDRETYDAVQAEMARRKAARSPSKKNSSTGLTSYTSKYALSERLICGECGTLYRRCVWTARGNRRVVWRCVSRLDYGKKYCHNSPTLDENVLQRTILAAINSTMSGRSELISEITDAMRIELVPPQAGRISLGEIERSIKKREQEFQLLFDSMHDIEDLTKRAEDFQRITDELAKLKAERARYLEDEKKDNASAWKLREAREAMEAGTGELTEWDESVIRQLVDTVRVVSADKLKIYLHSGIEIEQDMLR